MCLCLFGSPAAAPAAAIRKAVCVANTTQRVRDCQLRGIFESQSAKDAADELHTVYSNQLIANRPPWEITENLALYRCL